MKIEKVVKFVKVIKGTALSTGCGVLLAKKGKEQKVEFADQATVDSLVAENFIIVLPEPKKAKKEEKPAPPKSEKEEAPKSEKKK